MEDQALRRSRRLQNLPPFTTVEPPSPPQRWILDTDGSFEPVGISEFPGEMELRTNQFDTKTVDIEGLEDDNCARNFNSPLIDLNDPVIIQVHPFNSPVIGVPVTSLMASAGEIPSTPISAILAKGVPPPPVGTPRTNIPTTPLTPTSQANVLQSN